jgi:hypothetical protein
MKKILLLVSLLALVCVAQAQLPRVAKAKTHSYSAYSSVTPYDALNPIYAGQWGSWNTLGTDSLKSNDTMVVVFPIFNPTFNTKEGNTLFPNICYPYITFDFESGVTDTATIAANVTVTYWGSMTPDLVTATATTTNYHWFQLKYGNNTDVQRGVYAPTALSVVKTSGVWFEHDFVGAQVFTPARYVAVRLISATKSGFVKKPIIKLRNNTK